MPEAQDDTAKEIDSRIGMHEDATRRHYDDFVMFEQMWHSIPHEHSRPKGRKGKKKSTRDASTFVPEFWRDVESVVSDQMALEFGDQPWFELVPNSWDADLIVKAFKTQAFLEAQLEEMDFEVEYEDVVRAKSRDGTGLMETSWDFQTHWEMDRKNRTGKEVMDREGPGIRNRPLIGFHFYPYRYDMKGMPWTATVEKVHARDVKKIIADAQRYMERLNIDAKVETPEEALEGNAPPDSEDADYMKRIQESQRWDPEADEDGLVELIDYWGEHPIKADSPYIWRIVVANRQKTIFEIPHLYDHGEHPILRTVHVPRQRSFYGMGVGHQIWRKQKEINDFRGYGRDLIKFQLLNQWMRKGGTEEGIDRFELEPLKIYTQEEIGELTPIRPPIEALSSLLVMEERDLEAMRYASGATHAAQGIPTGTTATEFKGAERVTDRRVLQIAKRDTRMGLRPFLRRMIQLNKQFGVKPRLVHVLGRPMLVSAAELTENVTIKLRMATDVDFRGQMARRTTAALETLLKVAEFKSKIPNSPYNLDPVVAQQVKLLGVDPQVVVPEARKAMSMLGMNQLGPINQDDLMRELAGKEIDVAQQATEAGPAPAPVVPGGGGLL